MAIVYCPECGKEISDKANTCPNCGYPIKEESMSKRNITGLNSVSFNCHKNKKFRLNKKGITICIISAICAIIVLFLSVLGYSYVQNKKETQTWQSLVGQWRNVDTKGNTISSLRFFDDNKVEFKDNKELYGGYVSEIKQNSFILENVKYTIVSDNKIETSQSQLYSKYFYDDSDKWGFGGLFIEDLGSTGDINAHILKIRFKVKNRTRYIYDEVKIKCKFTDDKGNEIDTISLTLNPTSAIYSGNEISSDYDYHFESVAPAKYVLQVSGYKGRLY